MLSRVAERLFWMARYLERAEDTARIISVNTHLLLDLPKGTIFGWEPLIFIIGDERDFHARYPQADEQRVVQFMSSDQENPSSILSSLHQARENLRTTRDSVPREAWEKLNQLYLYARDQGERMLARRSRYPFLAQIMDDCQLITGLLAGTMSHDYAYEFVRLGRNLERADMTTRIIDVRSANLLPKHTGELSPFGNIQWMSVLRSLSAYQMYRRHVHVRVRGAEVLGFLLQDAHFPRSLGHCLGEMQRALSVLPRHVVPLRNLARLMRQIGDANVVDLSHEGLHEFIDQLQLALGKLHERIRATYFLSDSPAPRSDSIAA